MGPHALSDADVAFAADFAAGRLAPASFDHRAHVRLAYCLLAGAEVETVVSRLRELLLAFLHSHGIDQQKYHATLTRAWVLAVRHFMAKGPCTSADDFLARHPQLLDRRILQTHYSAELLASAAARLGFVPPDRQPIPEPRVHQR